MLGGRAAELHLGMDVEQQRQQRRGFREFRRRDPRVRGALRPRTQPRAGIRRQPSVVAIPATGRCCWESATALSFWSTDRFVTVANPDDSGRVRYSPTRRSPDWCNRPARTCACTVRGTRLRNPTFNELGYRAAVVRGSRRLRPAVSRNLERRQMAPCGGARIGERVRHRYPRRGGRGTQRRRRSSYHNVGASPPRGIALSLWVPVSPTVDIKVHTPGLDARFRSAFPICTGAGCQSGDAGGRRQPIPVSHEASAGRGMVEGRSMVGGRLKASAWATWWSTTRATNAHLPTTLANLGRRLERPHRQTTAEALLRIATAGPRTHRLGESSTRATPLLRASARSRCPARVALVLGWRGPTLRRRAPTSGSTRRAILELLQPREEILLHRRRDAVVARVQA